MLDIVKYDMKQYTQIVFMNPSIMLLLRTNANTSTTLTYLPLYQYTLLDSLSVLLWSV